MHMHRKYIRLIIKSWHDIHIFVVGCDIPHNISSFYVCLDLDQSSVNPNPRESTCIFLVWGNLMIDVLSVMIT